MLKEIICHLVDKVQATDYFEKVFPFVELLAKGPAEYIGKGQYSDVTRFDHYNGMAYFRKNGDAITSRLERDGVPCGMWLNIETPMRMVACVPKAKLEEDDAFADEYIAETFTKVLSFEGGALVSDIKASYLSSIPVRVVTDNKSVLSQEYDGTLEEINFSYAYLAIDFNVTVQIKSDCITDCNNY